MSVNLPTFGTNYKVIVYGNENNHVSQMATLTGTSITYIRSYQTTWSSWKRNLTTDDAYSPPTTPFSLFSEINGRPANITEYKAGAVVSGASLYATSTLCYYDGAWKTVDHTLESTDVTNVGIGTWKLMDIAPNYGGWGFPGTWKRIA